MWTQVALEMRRWAVACTHVCVCEGEHLLLFPFSSSLPFTLLWLFLLPPSPQLASAGHDGCFFSGRSTRRSSSVWMKSEDTRGVSWVDGCIWALRSCYWGQGSTCHLSMRHKRSCRVTMLICSQRMFPDHNPAHALTFEFMAAVGLHDCAAVVFRILFESKSCIVCLQLISTCLFLWKMRNLF